jgi:hypothetical protein
MRVAPSVLSTIQIAATIVPAEDIFDIKLSG